MTGLLLDTNVLLWWLSGEIDRLGPQVEDLIAAGEHTVHVSAISAVEIAVKQSIGKLQAPDDLPRRIATNDFAELALSILHGVALATLPRHHRDPFDRILVAQAMTERLTLLSGDRALSAYDVKLVLCSAT